MDFGTFCLLALALLFVIGVSSPFVIGVYTFFIEPWWDKHCDNRRLKRNRADTKDDSHEPAWLKRSKKRNQRQEKRRLRVMKTKDPLAYRATINGRTKAQQAAVEQREKEWESV